MSTLGGTGLTGVKMAVGCLQEAESRTLCNVQSVNLTLAWVEAQATWGVSFVYGLLQQLFRSSC
jgi:hypothetical protein